jgi:hypothetical protein
MWVAAVVIAARGACFSQFAQSGDNTFQPNDKRKLRAFGVTHLNAGTVVGCSAATVNVSYDAPANTYELLGDFIDQQTKITFAKESECEAGTNLCKCFDASELRSLIDRSILEKTDVTYQTVAAACPLIETADAQVIASTSLKKVRVVGIVTNKTRIPVGTYAFACLDRPSTYFLLRENRLLAQAAGADDVPTFELGLFRDVALSKIEDCQCQGTEVTELLAQPATLKKSIEKVPPGVWFDTSFCKANMQNCLIEEMERQCSECPPGKTVTKECGLFYDTVCTGVAHSPQADAPKTETNNTGIYIVLGAVAAVALIVFMQENVKSAQREATPTSKSDTKLKLGLRMF